MGLHPEEMGFGLLYIVCFTFSQLIITTELLILNVFLFGNIYYTNYCDEKMKYKSLSYDITHTAHLHLLS